MSKMKYYHCLLCGRFLPNILKIEGHLEHCFGIQRTQNSNQTRGKRPIEIISFKECYIPIVRNQIDPEFLKQYETVEAKSDEENDNDLQPHKSIQASRKSDRKGLTLKQKLRSKKKAKSKIRKQNSHQQFMTPQPLSLDLVEQEKNEIELLCIRRKSSTPQICSKCGKSFITKRFLDLHVKTVHRRDYDITRQCLFCRKLFLNYRDLEIHVRAHIEEKPFTCKICKREFNTKEGCTYHMRRHDPNRPLIFECQLCPKKFPYRSGLAQHLLSHRKEKPFKCPICQKGCRNNRDRRVHLETHKDKTQRERNVKCNECGKTFYNQDNLKTHMKSHSNIRPFRCEVCSYSFRAMNELKKHMETHDKNRQRKWKCDLCPKRFFDRSALQGHMIVHTGKRPHKCPVCRLGFQTRRGARRHKSLVHDRLRPYQCTVCGSRFGLKHNWITHTKTNQRCKNAKCMIDGESGNIVVEQKPDLKLLKIKKEERMEMKMEEEDHYYALFPHDEMDPLMLVTDVKLEFPMMTLTMDYGLKR